MSLLKVYWRVLKQLGPETRLGMILLTCNIVLACIMFAEPILFGRIIDTLTRAQAQGRVVTWAEILPLVIAWVVFGLFTITAGVLVALHADRMSHRRRLAFMQHFFEHVLNLPLSYHSGAHSGRLLKQMLEGSNAMAWLLLSFLREHCASIIALVILVPVSLWVNWRLGSLLVVMVFFFFFLTSWVLRRTESLQGSVQEYHNALAERATDALGNVPVIQSFTRVEAEVRAMRATVDALLAAQIPVLSWWAIAAVASRASATLTVLSIFLVGTWLHINGLATIGEIVTFMGFATMLIGKLEALVGFINAVFLEGPKIKDFFDVVDTAPQVRDRPNATDIGRVEGTVAFENVSFSYDGKRPAVADLSFVAKPGDTIALVGSTGSGKSTTCRCSTASSIRSPAACSSTATTSATFSSSRSGGTSASSSRSRCSLPAPSARTCRSAGPRRPRRRSGRPAPAPRRPNSSSANPTGSTPRWPSAAARSPAARGSASPSPAPC